MLRDCVQSRFEPRPQRLRMANIKALLIKVFAVIALLALSYQWLYYPIKLIEMASSNDELSDSCELLSDLNLTPSFRYARHCFRARPQRSVDYTMQRMIEPGTPLPNVDLFVDLSPQRDANQSCRYDFEPCQHVDDIEVPSIEKLNTAATRAIMFGMATPLDRFSESLPYHARWLAASGSQLVVLVTGQSDQSSLETARQEAMLHKCDIVLIPENEAEINVTIANDAKHFATTKVMHKHKKAHHHWFVVIDDDTFFPSVLGLAKALQPFDTTLPWYIGTLTEDWYQISRWGLMAWGGAGIFLSTPLLETLTEHNDDCLRDYPDYSGDGLVTLCVYQYTSPPVPLTTLPGLYQNDLHPSLDGFFEAGLEPFLSFHHYRSWYQYSADKGHLSSDVTGPSAFLMRYKFANSYVLTNGYSLVKYDPATLADIDFGLMEATFPDVHFREDILAENVHTFRLGETRPKLEQGSQKTSYLLEHAVKQGEIVRQFYIKRGDDQNPDEVIEIDWQR